MTAVSINLDSISQHRLIQMLEDLESTKKALMKLLHTSEAERTLFLQDVAILQSVYMQLLGIEVVPNSWQVYWSQQPSADEKVVAILYVLNSKFADEEVTVAWKLLPGGEGEQIKPVQWLVRTRDMKPTKTFSDRLRTFDDGVSAMDAALEHCGWGPLHQTFDKD